MGYHKLQNTVQQNLKRDFTYPNRKRKYIYLIFIEIKK